MESVRKRGELGKLEKVEGACKGVRQHNPVHI